MSQVVPCPDCGRELAVSAQDTGEKLACPSCGAHFHAPGPLRARRVTDSAGADGNRIACGVVALVIGGLGIHKFMLGLTGPGLVMLLVSLLTCGLGGIVMHAIAIAEGIIYLTKSDED